eukprot:442560-Ditylum_brightwellii.AAC.1
MDNVVYKLATLLLPTLIWLSPDEIDEWSTISPCNVNKSPFLSFTSQELGIRVNVLNWLPKVEAENTDVNGVT